MASQHFVMLVQRLPLTSWQGICRAQDRFVHEPAATIIADNPEQSPVGVGAASQRLILAGERSGLLTRIATTGSGSLCTRMKS
jgi:hypothetical protein